MVEGRAPVRRGDIWLATLDPTRGGEVQKTRPCLIVSPFEMHDYLRTIIIVPMTTGSQPARYRIPFTFEGKAGLILLDQVRTLDKQRFIKRLGAVPSATLLATLECLRDVFEE